MSDAADVIALAQDAARAPEEIERGKLLALPVTEEQGASHFEIVDTEQYGTAPYDARGTTVLHEPASFVRYVKTFGFESTALYADIDDNLMSAVINGHTIEDAGWGDHRAELYLRLTPEWRRWTASDGRGMKQEAFAEFIEESLADIREPSSADMLELAQTFEAKKNVSFRSQNRLADGQRQLMYAEQIEAKAGQTGQLKVPESIVLALSPYEGGQPYRVTARFRFTLGNEGGLTVKYKLDRSEDVLKAAFGDVIGNVEEDTGLSVYRGVAPVALR